MRSMAPKLVLDPNLLKPVNSSISSATWRTKGITYQQDPEYLSLNKTLNDVVIPFQDRFYADPASFPLAKMQDAVQTTFIDAAARRTPGSDKFNALGSSFADEFHATIGAAYCSLFTCDRLTSTGLTQARRHLGLAPPVVFGGGFDAFVQDLRGTWNTMRS